MGIYKENLRCDLLDGIQVARTPVCFLGSGLFHPYLRWCSRLCLVVPVQRSRNGLFKRFSVLGYLKGKPGNLTRCSLFGTCVQPSGFL